MQIPGEVPEGSGEGFRRRYMVRFRRVPVQIPEGSGEGFRRRYMVRFR